MVTNLANPDTGLFQNLTPDRLLDGLALIDKSCKGRLHACAGQTARRLTQQAPVAVYDEHDGHWIGTRKMFGFAVWTLAYVAAPLL